MKILILIQFSPSSTEAHSFQADFDRDGVINGEDLDKLIERFKPNCDARVKRDLVSRILSEGDRNKDGKLNIAEFEVQSLSSWTRLLCVSIDLFWWGAFIAVEYFIFFHIECFINMKQPTRTKQTRKTSEGKLNL